VNQTGPQAVQLGPQAEQPGPDPRVPDVILGLATGFTESVLSFIDDIGAEAAIFITSAQRRVQILLDPRDSSGI